MSIIILLALLFELYEYYKAESEDPSVAERHRPGKQERYFEIENDEKERNEVEANVKPAPRIFKWLKTTLIGGEFLGIRVLLNSEIGGADEDDAQNHDQPNEN